MKRLYLSFGLMLGYWSLCAQTGPGGVGTTDGTSALRQWLRADAGLTLVGDSVSAWAEQSGVSATYTPVNADARPVRVLSHSAFNNQPVLRFVTGPSLGKHIRRNAPMNYPGAFSAILVLKSDSTPVGDRGFFLGTQKSQPSLRTKFGLWQSGLFWRSIGGAGSNHAVGTWTIGTNAGIVELYRRPDNTNEFSFNGGSYVTITPTNLNSTDSLLMTSFDIIGCDETNAPTFARSFKGFIGEVIIYNSYLTSKQRLQVLTYLWKKYRINLQGQDAILFRNAHYNLDTSARNISGGLYLYANQTSGNTLDPGEEVYAVSNNASHDVVSSDLADANYKRWTRIWTINKVGTVGAIISFGTNDAGLGNNNAGGRTAADYALLYRPGTSGSFSVVTGVSAVLTDTNRVTFTLTNSQLLNGQYTLGIKKGKTWYSYTSGNWNNPLTWTLDGAVTPLYINPSNQIPGPMDDVVIMPGKTVTIPNTGSDSINITSLTVYGRLDVGSSRGHNFNVINGNGIIRISGTNVGGNIVENFPNGNITGLNGFASAGVGGTVELQAANIRLDKKRVFNHMLVRLPSSTDTVTLLSHITLNGNFTIRRGIFRFNNNTSTVNDTLIVYGDVIVENDGGSNIGYIRVGTGNARHEFSLYGNFTNNSEVRFTNRTEPAITSYYNAEATDGIVDVNFYRNNADQTLTCNGKCVFYRIEIDKGTDYSYILDIFASDTNNFHLLGFANIYHPDQAQLNPNQVTNALGLVRGTVRLNNNVRVPMLTINGNYNISEGARIWVNGGHVGISGSNALVPYGVFKITAGTANIFVPHGIVLRDAGLIEVNGGTLNTWQVRTSVIETNDIGGYVQTGGVVNVGNGSSNLSYYLFSLIYPNNTFTMTGGELYVFASNGTTYRRGSIFINSGPGFYNVTGGTVYLVSNSTNTPKVTSRAPFYNFVVRRTSATASNQIWLDSGSAGDDHPYIYTIANPTLTVLNDFVIQSPSTPGMQTCIFDTKGYNVNVYGDLTIQAGSRYEAGTGTLTFLGSGTSVLDMNNRTDSVVFYNLVLNKNNATDDLLILNSAKDTSVRVRGALIVTNGIFDYTNQRIRLDSTLDITTVVGRSTSTGLLAMRRTSSQTIFSRSLNAQVYNLQINNASGVTLTNNNLNILGTLSLTNGVFNIGIYKLRLQGSGASIAGSGYSTSKMIMTAGNVSDGGLEMYCPASVLVSRFFPIGTNANGVTRYTPLKIDYAATTDDGYIQVNPVDMELPLLNQSVANSALTYYWRIRVSDFSVNPYVYMEADYASSDVPTGDNPSTQYVPGWVMNNVRVINSGSTPGDGYVTSSKIYWDNDGSGGISLSNSYFTAARPPKFAGTIKVYYSRAVCPSGLNHLNWNNPNHWTFSNNHIGAAAGSIPQAGDIVVIGFGHQNNDPSACDTWSGGQDDHWVMINGYTANCAEVLIRSNGGWGPRLRLENNAVLNASRLGFFTGTENNYSQIDLRYGTSGNPSLANTDVAEYNTHPNYGAHVYDFYVLRNDTVTLPSNISVYPTVRFETDVVPITRMAKFPIDVVVKGDVYLNWGGSLLLKRNLTVEGNMIVGNEQTGVLRFSTDSASTLTIYGNLTVGPATPLPATNVIVDVANNVPNSLLHKLIVHGNLNLRRFQSFDLFGGNSPTDNNVVLEVAGASNTTMWSDTTATPDLYRLVVNKGSDTTSTFTANMNFNLLGAANGTIKPLVMQNGKFVMNHSSLNLNINSGGVPNTIAGSAGIVVQQGTLRTSGLNNGIILDGLLRVAGGTVNIDSGSIQYTTSGNSTIVVTSGTLTVGGHVRRDINTPTGTLKYIQSGGTATFGNTMSDATTRGIFEVLNTGSSFTHTGGSFTIVRGNGTNPTISALYLDPQFYSVGTSSTITFGNANTPTAQVMGITSKIPLRNIVVNNTNNPTVRIRVDSLLLNGDLTLNSGTTFQANGFNLAIQGNFVNNGTFVSDGNSVNQQRTYFYSSSTQTISGTGTTNFYNLYKGNSNTLNISKDITVHGTLFVDSGTIATGANACNVKGKVIIDGTHTSTTGRGIVFNGTELQLLERTHPGTSNIDRITVDNLNGVLITDGGGYVFNILKKLVLENGVFDISGNFLVIGVSATVENASGGTGVNDFNATRMIQTNSSFTDFGVRKIFPSGPSTFVFPVGQNLYTPVRVNVTSTNSAGLTVRPAYEMQAGITEDSEAPDPSIVDTLNALNYHWILRGNGFTNFNATVTFFYQDTLVRVTPPYTEANYTAARILYSSLTWDKAYDSTSVNEGSNQIIFTFTSANDDGISGEYLAGVNVNNSNVNIKGAIPDIVPKYQTNGSGGNYTASSTWTPIGSSPAVVNGVGPAGGSYLVILPNDTVNINVSNVRLLRVEIGDSAMLVINSGVLNTRLGVVEGNGMIKVFSGDLPAGYYDDFLPNTGCTGASGGLEYSGNTNYQTLLLLPRPFVGMLKFTGSGEREISTSITVCKNMEILNSVNVTNEGNFNITVKGNIYKSDASDFYAGTGTIIMNGTTPQILNGDFSGSDFFYNLTMNNAAGITIANTADPLRGISSDRKVHIANQYTISGGTVTANADLTIRRNMTNNGTFTASTGQTTFFNHPTTQTYSGTGTTNFGNLRKDSTGTLNVNGNITVNGDWDMRRGTFALNANLISRGNIYKSDIATFSAGTSTVTLNGTTTQRIVGQFTGASVFRNMVINNSSDTGVNIVNAADALRGIAAGGDVQVNGTLTMTDGVVTTSSTDRFILGPSATGGTISSFSKNSYFNGIVDKYGLEADGTFTFPVGVGYNAFRYGPVVISNASAGDWNAQLFHGNPTTVFGSTINPSFVANYPLANVSKVQYWVVEGVSTGATANVGITWDSLSDVGNTVAKRAELRVMYWNGSMWIERNSTVNEALQRVSTNAHPIPFSSKPITLGSPNINNNPLPVDLLDFKAVVLSEKVQLRWQVSTLASVTGFVVLRSADGANFELLANLTPSSQQQYILDDNSPVAGTNYYKLVVNLSDGSTLVSKVVSVVFEGRAEKTVLLYPTTLDAGQEINLEMIGFAIGKEFVLRLMDITGNQVLEVQGQLRQDISAYTIVLPDNLSRGIYVAQIKVDGETFVRKLLVK
ncbi:MAG: hypothetical protein NZM38_02020 [Cytophagales bacterium]|nr:hypothetical protein [Cytophagales bacterium]MDW8383529.1 hypothetical protein [Flammeovirgaceae bacterium]